MIEYTLEEIKNPNYGYLSGNNGEIKYTGKSITPNGTIKLTTSGTVDVIATNPQKYIRLAGFVWEDNAPGKDSKISNKYEDTDYKVEGIQVKLYKNGTFIAETKTDENGEYQFGTENKDHYENTDYVLPGINGLDLEIARRYDSQSASLGTPDAEVVTHYEYVVYCVIVSGTAYSDVPGYGCGRWPANDVPPTQVGAFTSYMKAEELRASCETTVRKENFQGDVDLIIEYTAKIVTNYIGTIYGLKSTTKPNDYFQKLYGLGCGWRLNFSSIEISGNQKYLHLAAGETYEIKSDSSGLHLKDYPLDDLTLTKQSNLFSNGSTHS